MTVEKSTATSFYHYLRQHKYGLNFETTIEGFRKRNAWLSLSLTGLRQKRGRNICVWVAGGGRFQASLLPDFVPLWVIPVEARVSQPLGFVEF
jgi:hypothetical protein